MNKYARIVCVDNEIEGAPRQFYLVAESPLHGLQQFEFLCKEMQQKYLEFYGVKDDDKILNRKDYSFHDCFFELPFFLFQNKNKKWVYCNIITCDFHYNGGVLVAEAIITILTSGDCRELYQVPKQSPANDSPQKQSGRKNKQQKQYPEAEQAFQLGVRRLVELSQYDGHIVIRCCEDKGYLPFVLSRDNKEKLHVFNCPECKKEFCNKCGNVYHRDLPCDIGLSDDDILAVLQDSKLCPNCRQSVQQIDGCNHISCWCGAHFCFLCETLFGIGRGFEDSLHIHYRDSVCNQF